jgi:hypothetical protein
MGKFLVRAAAVIAGPAAALSLVLAGQGASAAITPAAGLACHARISNAHPSDFSTVYVHVLTVSHGKVTATAHFKSGKVLQKHRANLHGRTSLAFSVGKAAAGFKVVVSVSVRFDDAKGSCSTSFTP